VTATLNICFGCAVFEAALTRPSPKGLGEGSEGTWPPFLILNPSLAGRGQAAYPCKT
jgi:hypothetical protein